MMPSLRVNRLSLTGKTRKLQKMDFPREGKQENSEK